MNITGSLFINSIFIGAIEGITEFLPISSTTHIILAEKILNFKKLPGTIFETIIQLSAVLAILVIYHQRIIGMVQGFISGRDMRPACNIIIASLPLLIIATIFASMFQHLLFSPILVASSLIIGGLAIIVIERLKLAVNINDFTKIDIKTAVKIGLVQCFALIPGFSRSGTTIMGGLLFGLGRRIATEFSFFLAMPIMLASSLYSLYSARLSISDFVPLLLGCCSAFITAMIAVRFLLKFISHHGFTYFAVYRIALGVAILLYLCLFR